MIDDMDVRISPPSKRGGLRNFKLLSPYDYHDGRVVEAGKEWNGASSFIGRQRGLFSSLAHDDDYDKMITIVLKVGWRKQWPLLKKMKLKADQNLRRHMVSHDNQHRVLAWIFYIGVRLGGWVAIWWDVRAQRKANG